MPHENLVVVGGRREDSSRNVFVINDVAEAELRWLYDRATALLSVSKEDFGLTPIEANSFGTPALLVKAGGFLDSLDEGTSGLFIEDTSIRGIVNSVETFPRHWDSAKIRAHAARFSFEEFERKLKQVVTDTVENLADPEHIGEDTAYAKRNIVD
ncbi:hypothetical protein ASG04_09855 [Curtobacterium sp. Leaf183]|nr:hypothetical protein ASG04_09855 [Curtobacterium sp. Leaf183]